ncbi:efflux RND transporter periplasmic adaptor subunit [Caldichromatium japonicum]|uniref:Efflux RND transporter periplasmic adaptor subunit n=2 Tax=Caldichromatium japonicum TaxID=2699430 RepID=A0A6G7VGX0_9GAMM|nr:efflux RND transporter periplasmic adaptor subunit [Caldichromatium japonicum]
MIFFALVGCSKPHTPSPGPGMGPSGPPEVGVIALHPQTVNLTVELPGRTSAYRIAEVRPQVGGIIQERLFKEGSQVQASQVLYQIDAAPYQAAYESAQAALERARAGLERARLKAERAANLLKARAVSQEDYDDAEAARKEAAAAVAVAEAEVKRARIELDYTRIKAPIGGRIGRSLVTQGALVTANQAQALATIQQLDPIYVDLTQASVELLRLRRALQDGRLQRPAGDQPRVTLILEDGRDYPHPGRLEFAEVSVEPTTASIILRAIIPNPDQVLLPGMFVRARVEEGQRQGVLLVPQRAVQRDRQGRPYVLVLNADDQVEQRLLQTERIQGDAWLVEGGVAAGERLILDGLQRVRPGDQARAIALDATPGASGPAAPSSP